MSWEFSIRRSVATAWLGTMGLKIADVCMVLALELSVFNATVNNGRLKNCGVDGDWGVTLGQYFIIQWECVER
jgi:hypothetical protein